MTIIVFFKESMKKPIILLFASLFAGTLFYACDNTKTYSEMLEDERDAIKAFVRENNIAAISQEDFEKDTVTNVEKNEYVLFSNGVYMQIVDRGSGRMAENRDKVLVRFIEYDIMGKDTTLVSNVLNPYEAYNLYPDAFYYTKTSTTSYGQFISNGIDAAGIGFNMVSYYGSSAVPSGWLLPLQYIRDGAHVTLIVPSKMGHAVAQEYVTPYFYDIRKFQIK
ncbi:hypothetical protein EZS27_024262 [termite gut metagenome]|uniref:DUF4827 domain-containing protein n=1 Tax=termite gut metagenome TaxID=433724 RepID=A0A5J4QZW8_9ZZZZ